MTACSVKDEELKMQKTWLLGIVTLTRCERELAYEAV
jgi:hypothetical protein